MGELKPQVHSGSRVFASEDVKLLRVPLEPLMCLREAQGQLREQPRAVTVAAGSHRSSSMGKDSHPCYPLAKPPPPRCAAPFKSQIELVDQDGAGHSLRNFLVFYKSPPILLYKMQQGCPSSVGVF